MSRTAVRKQQNTREVIARAFGDEPLRLIAKRSAGGLVELDSDGETALFLENDVFPFDADLFNELKRAFEVGDKNALSRLWAEAMNAT